MKTWSNRRLLLFFACALLAFIPLRWDATPWLQTQKTNLLQQLPFAVDVGSIHWSTGGINIENVAITLPPPAKPLLLQQLTLSPTWGAWLQGTPVVHASLSSDAINGQCDVLVDDGYVQLSAIELAANVPWLQTQWGANIPVALQGMLHATGHMQWYAKDGSLPQPIAGTITITWQTAGVQLGESIIALGDYTLLIQDHMPASWRLQLDGGELLKLHGETLLQSHSIPWPQWPLQGMVEITHAPNSPLSALLSQQQKITLSGTLLAPEWRM